MSVQDSDASTSLSSRRRFRLSPVVLLLLFFAAPALGGFLSLLQVFRDGFGVNGLRGVSGVALSPDGKQLYAVGAEDNGLVVFRRRADGLLRFRAFHEDGVGGVFGLVGAAGVAASPDGRHVYATGRFDDTLVVFSRDATNESLTFVAAEVKQNLVGSVFGLNGAKGVAVSPDNEQVFVASRVDDALAVFSRDATSDALSFVDAYFDGAGGVRALNGACAVAVSPDSRHVYVASDVSDAVAVFRRRLARGTVSFVMRAADGRDGVDGLAGASSVAVSPDGRHVYATGRVDDSVVAFLRDPLNGRLTFLARYRDGEDGIDGLEGAAAVTLNPAGDRVLVAGQIDDAVAVFRRHPLTGELVFLERVRDGGGGVNALAGAAALAATFREVYAGAYDDDALTTFDLAFCLGNQASGDSDADAICDDVDLCLGDDLAGDGDGDGVCDDRDRCPGFDDGLDADLDGVPDACDPCFGLNLSGDSDGDGVCDDRDVCSGFPDGFDADFDGVPDACDPCFGHNPSGDGDGDGTCNDRDTCQGDDATGDDDGDGVCADLDLCFGGNATGDADGDGICADRDCDDDDDANVCSIFADGFESGDISAWSLAIP
jgi:6-phosphogluconolactonase (cycloisomerase 2 family)